MTLQLQDELKQHLAKVCGSAGGQLPLDEAVIGALPKGVKAKSSQPYGVSAWSFTAKVNAVDSRGLDIPFFLKYVAGDLGKRQLAGEFKGMTELCRAAPDLVPKPLTWGKLMNTEQEAYFILVEFKDLVPGLPDPSKLGARLAAMHQKSAIPGGKFGFPIQTYDGVRLQAVDWDDRWTSFFSKLLAEAYRQDTETNEIWAELDVVFKRVQSHLIPRLIGALEADGRSVTPVLIHGDLWDGNVANDSETGDPWIFDCAAYYAHNEMELGIWRAKRHGLSAEIYRQEYRRHFEASEPKEEWDDRNLLYSVKTNFMHSACFAGSPSRQSAFEDMKYLIQKYVPGDTHTERAIRRNPG
ncbi:Fructosamine kinase-domain-containing protein [Xylariomycetidae sp. FL0641]|nr:Fructosamine kinase-domain-containing protein [Xylariomycetidae sp. FL0641]